MKLSKQRKKGASKSVAKKPTYSKRQQQHDIEKKLKSQLVLKRKIIKNKLELLKHGEIAQEKMLSPITHYLRNIETKMINRSQQKDEKIPPEVKSLEMKLEKKEKKPLTTQSTPNINVLIPPKQETEEIYTNESFDENDNVFLDPQDLEDRAFASSTSNISQEVYDEYLAQYHPLPRKYISILVNPDNAENDEFDHKYGIRYDPNIEAFFIGDSRIEIDNDKNPDIIVQRKRYKGTPGLYELLFKKSPQHYTKEDKKIYGEILKKTNAHRRYYKANQQISGSKLPKYKEIIASLVQEPQLNRSQSIEGGGMQLEVNNNSIDYVYWDDPNELVDRLRLLLASQRAGNSNQNNEIIRIIEELREAGIIT